MLFAILKIVLLYIFWFFICLLVVFIAFESLSSDIKVLATFVLPALIMWWSGKRATKSEAIGIESLASQSESYFVDQDRSEIYSENHAIKESNAIGVDKAAMKVIKKARRKERKVQIKSTVIPTVDTPSARSGTNFGEQVSNSIGTLKESRKSVSVQILASLVPVADLV